jgi:hypothetical protein
VLRLCLGDTVRRGTEDGNILIGVTSVARAQQWQPVERQESEEGGAVPPTRKMGVAVAVGSMPADGRDSSRSAMVASVHSRKKHMTLSSVGIQR